jgi:dinuclear metal center YbgI/SA1388 family protein
MVTIKELYTFLDSVAPFSLQEDYDNAGMIVGDESQLVSGVLVSLDTTEEVIQEAMERGCNVVVAHHPIVFRGVKNLRPSNYINRALIKAIKADIAIIAIHTNLDNVLKNGVNETIALRLGLQNLSILAPKDKAVVDIGAGIVGYTQTPIDTLTYLQHIKETMKASAVKYTKVVKPQVRKVAICGGSGSFLLNNAKMAGADLFITSDFKYHEYFDANGEIIVVDIGHYESEQYTTELLVELISQNFSNFASHYTKVNTNPVNYL